jgi:hypothetical protein
VLLCVCMCVCVPAFEATEATAAAGEEPDGASANLRMVGPFLNLRLLVFTYIGMQNQLRRSFNVDGGNKYIL